MVNNHALCFIIDNKNLKIYKSIMADNVYDAIVIGSGISGGWAAKELTEKGLKTLMLERGRKIEHWYDYAEKFAGISGSREGLPQLPDGQFLPPMDMTCVEKDVAARIKEYYKGKRAMIIGRVANITVPHEGRTNCQFRNKCWLG